MLGSKKEFVITETQTHGPGHDTVYRSSELSVIQLSYPDVKGLKTTYYVTMVTTKLDST